MSVFKISPNDPDLKMFEKCITNFHPEFYVLKQNGKPSYEHPDFCEKTLEFKFIPGNKDPYDIHALNFMTRAQADLFIDDKLCLLGVSLAQKVKTSKQEDKFRKKLLPVIENIHFNDKKGRVTIAECMEKIAIYVLRGYVSLIFNYFKFKRYDDIAVRIIPQEIEDIKKRCSTLSKKFYNSSKSLFLNNHSGINLSRLSRYSIFTRIFIDAYNQRKFLYIDKAIALLKESGINITDDDIRTIDMINYVDVILVNELSNTFLKLEREEKPDKKQPKERIRNPAEFSHTCYYSGKIEYSRNIYRKLFIKAWAYAYLKDKEISANKLSIHLSDFDEFFLSGESTSNGIEDYQETRRRTLNDYFSEWRKHSNEGKGFLSKQLNDVCLQPYWLNSNDEESLS